MWISFCLNFCFLHSSVSTILGTQNLHYKTHFVATHWLISIKKIVVFNLNFGKTQIVVD